MSDNRKHIDEIKSKLDAVERKSIYKEIIKGINVVIISGLLLNILLSIIISAGASSIGERTFFYFALVVTIGLLIMYFVVLPLFKTNIFFKPDYFKLADIVGKQFPGIKDQLKNTLQLIHDSKSYERSKTMIDAAFEKAYEQSKNLNFKSVISFAFTKKYFAASAGVIVFSVLLFAIFPGLRNASYRMLNYSKEFVEPRRFEFIVDPGNAEVAKGDKVEIKITAIGDIPDGATIAVKTDEQTEFQETDLSPDSLGNFNYRMNAVSRSFQYYVHSENIYSEEYNIKVINRPIVSSLETKVIPPAYSGLSELVQKNNGNITALPGSRAEIKILSTKEISKAQLIFSDSTKTNFTVTEKAASASFVLKKELDYQIHLVDKQDNSNANPITYGIKLLTDLPPAIEMIEPNKDVKISGGNQLSLVSSISDDYGFDRLVMNYRLSASQFSAAWDDYKQVSIPINKKVKDDEIYYVWDLEPLFLAVNDVVSYYLEVFDNDNVNGPKSAKTPLFTIRVPSLDEMFAEAEDTQESAEQEIAETLKEVEEFNKELERISNELKQDNREISWEEKEKIEQAIKKFQEFEKKVEDIQSNLNEMQKQLQENNLLSEETMQKYMELQELMDELSGEELSEAFKKMQEMLETLNRDKTQQAFEDMQFNEEMFQKSLERTLNLLKRIQVEQKVDEIVKRIEDLEQKLEEAQNELSQKELNSEQEKKEALQKQNEISENMKRLEEEMEKLNEKMSEIDDMPVDQMEKMLEQMKEQANSETSEQTEQQITQNQKMEAMQNQQMMAQNMQSMKQQMQQMQQSMQMQNQMQVMYDMMKSLNDLITLSKEQEELKNNMPGMTTSNEQYNENSKKQSEIQRNLDKVVQSLVDLSQKTFAITPEMGKALGQARSQMTESLSAMQNRNSPRAIQGQNGAMKSLNEAATLLKSNMEQMMSGGQGGGMMSLMQQLQQMSQQQMNLNQLTQQLNQGQLSQQQQAQLQRLAQEQELIRKSLEQLNKEAKESGQSKRLSTNLEKVLAEMKEVVTNMQTEKVDDNLVQAQERILSKLLDAQRSINERDFEKERESTAGKTFNRESPPEIIFSTEEGKDKLRDELLKAIREGYSKDYEELIRKYYELLSSQKEDINRTKP